MDMLSSQAEVLHQLLNELNHGGLLCGGAGVNGASCVIFKTTDVAYANGCGIVTLAMGALLTQGTTLEDGTVSVDDIMITDGQPPVFLAVPATDIFHGDLLRFKSGRAMQDDFIYWS